MEMQPEPVYTPNGAKRASKVSFVELDNFRKVPDYIATIDFGTTHCSATILLLSHDLTKPVVVELDPNKEERIPVCVLFDRHGSYYSIGEIARIQHRRMPEEKRKKWFFLDHIKRAFQRNEDVSVCDKIKATNGAEFFLVDVIAQIINVIKEKIVKKANIFLEASTIKKLKAMDFDWVITVPAIWKATGKHMMRQAGYKAGLCSDVQVGVLKTAEQRRFERVVVKNPEKITLALEPESAAIECQEELKERGIQRKPSMYVVVDMGGGTVDIACHKISEDNLYSEFHPAEGHHLGGVSVNEEFSKFIGFIVEDPTLAKYQDPKYTADLNKLLYVDFEKEKLRFGVHDIGSHSNSDTPKDQNSRVENIPKLCSSVDNVGKDHGAFEREDRNMHSYIEDGALSDSDSGDEGDGRYEFEVELPGSFSKTYRKELKDVANSSEINDFFKIKIDEDNCTTLKFTSEQMKIFFEPSINETKKLLRGILDQHKGIDTIFWVGGFALASFVQQTLEKFVTNFIPDMIFSSPLKSSMAVIYGATAFRCKPDIIHERLASATYGTEGCIEFIDDIHDPKLGMIAEDVKQKLCTKIFQTVVERGERICTKEAFVVSVYPAASEQKIISIPVYTSDKNGVWYTNEEHVKYIGAITLDLEGHGIDREVEVAFDFTHSEIFVRARDRESQKEIKAILSYKEDRY